MPVGNFTLPQRKDSANETTAEGTTTFASNPTGASNGTKGNSSPIVYGGQGGATNGANQNNQNGFQLKNADINISQYGDDSSAKNYNNPALWG